MGIMQVPLLTGGTVSLDESFDIVEGEPTIENLLGRGDVELRVPEIGEEVELIGAHSEFRVARLEDDPGNSVFEIRGPVTRRLEFDKVYVTSDEEDCTEYVVGLGYLGIGGVVFMTENLDGRFVGGPNLELIQGVGMAYWSTENLRYLTSRRAIDHVRSFQAGGLSGIVIDDRDYVCITNERWEPKELIGKVAPNSYEVFLVGRDIRTGGFIGQKTREREAHGVLMDLSAFEIGGELYFVQPNVDAVSVFHLGEDGVHPVKEVRL